MVAIALPLAPLAPGAAAAAGTFVAGSAVYIAQQVHGFRAPLPPLPRAGGKAGGPTLKELVADAIAGARVPVAMPPNPLGPRGSWAAIGGAVLLGLLAKTAAQVWGAMKQVVLNPVPGEIYPPGPVYSPQGNYLRYCKEWNNACVTEMFQRFIRSYYNNGRLSYGSYVYDLYVTFVLSNGTEKTYKSPAAYTMAQLLEHKVVVQPGYTAIGATSPPGVVMPGTVPSIKPEPEVPPLVPLRRPAVPAPMQVPDPVPFEVPATPGPEPIPTTAPPPRPGLLPPTLPSYRPIENGVVASPRPQPPPVTDPDAVYPIPGRPPIVGNGPQANLQEMAKELGRIEAKLHSLMNPTGELNPIPEWMNDLGDGLSKLLQLWELLTATQAGGQYTLSSECVTDAEGNRVESVAEYSGAFNWLQVLSNKMDALAELQQHAKDLKQPICRHKPVGQPVQITFVETQ